MSTYPGLDTLVREFISTDISFLDEARRLVHAGLRTGLGSFLRARDWQQRSDSRGKCQLMATSRRVPRIAPGVAINRSGLSPAFALVRNSTLGMPEYVTHELTVLASDSLALPGASQRSGATASFWLGPPE